MPLVFGTKVSIILCENLSIYLCQKMSIQSYSLQQPPAMLVMQDRKPDWTLVRLNQPFALLDAVIGRCIIHNEALYLLLRLLNDRLQTAIDVG